MQVALIATRSWFKRIKSAADRLERSFCLLGDRLF